MADVESRIVRKERDSVTIRFVGDSGDGMQLTGTQFSTTSALAGNDIATLPDYPAEIRAPAGSLAGVSGFQLNFSSSETLTPGDQPDTLVAMNPAALKTNIADLRKGGLLILNDDSFTEKGLKLAGYTEDPQKSGSLEEFQVFRLAITKMTLDAVEPSGLNRKSAIRCKNFFALGLVYFLYDRPMEATLKWITQKFGKKPEVSEANTLALKAGWNFALTTELAQSGFRVTRAKYAPGTYRSINGNTAIAYGLITAAQKAGLHLFYGSYPITPASDILEELAHHQGFGVRTFQAEDEISAIGASIGAAFGGDIAVTGTSGPGIALKGESMGLAVMVELPLVIINVQRGGPSTGMPTKLEQADLLQALYGRHGECPLVVLAPQSPSDCFRTAIEAVTLALKYMTPVMLLSDGYLANGAEPWRIPDLADIPEIPVHFAQPDDQPFLPYKRDPQTLARPWAIPGTEGLMHRIGGLEKDFETGNVSYDPDNHERMIHIRAEKVANIVQDVPDLEVYGDASGEILVVGWGSTFGAIRSAVIRLQKAGHSVSSIHLRHMNPLPANLGKILSSFDRVLVPELNMGQFRMVLRGMFLVDAIGINQISGKPFKIGDLETSILEYIKSPAARPQRQSA